MKTKQSSLSAQPGHQAFLAILCLLLAAVAEAQVPVGNPFNIISNRADRHIIIFFDDHPEFSAAEAFIYTTGNPALDPAVRITLTHLNGSQEDWLNRVPMAKPGVERTSRQTAITMGCSSNGLDWNIRFFRTNGEECALVYFGMGNPEPAYGGLTDVSTHDPKGGLTLLWRDASSMGSKSCYVQFGNGKYRVSPDPAASKPPFFQAYRAYLSTGMSSLIFPTGVHILTDEQTPAAGISRIPLSRLPGATNDIRIEFNPPLPDWRDFEINETFTARFACHFGKSAPACTGLVRLFRADTMHAELSLIPEIPAWAARDRQLLYRLENTESGMRVNTTILEPRR